MPQRPGRLLLLALPLAVFAAFIAYRLVLLQVVDHEHYVSQAAEEHFADTTVYSQRGAILDSTGHPLAISIDTYDVYVSGRAWADGALAAEVARRLAPIVNVAEAEILTAVAAAGEADALILRDLPYDQGALLANGDFPGVIVIPARERKYPEGDLASNLIGFTGLDDSGLSGLEADYNDVLQGVPGSRVYERDSLGNPIAFGSRITEEPVAGADIVLTIDRVLQRYVEDELDKAIKARGAKGGTILIMDPRTGGILAMASRPSFRLTTLDLGGVPDQDMLKNRPVTDQYEPGSVFKVVTVAAAIDQGLVTPDSGYTDSGYWEVGGEFIRNWDFSENGWTTVTQILQKSLNTGSIYLANLMGPDAFYDYVSAFGFGAPTGVGLAGEADGLYRTPSDPAWSWVDLASNSFGQGINVTPLQVVTAFSAAINGGKLLQPHIVKEVRGPDGVEIFDPVVVRQVVSERTSAQMRSMLQSVVEQPRYPAAVREYSAGGKSGTSNVPLSTGYTAQTVASFIGFGPADDPRAVILVKLDHPQDDEFGSTVAGPVFSKLMTTTLHHLRIPPQDALVHHAGTD
jgi:cell division protein FtsI/penicillin-binding protein 2